MVVYTEAGISTVVILTTQDLYMSLKITDFQFIHMHKSYFRPIPRCGPQWGGGGTGDL